MATDSPFEDQRGGRSDTCSPECESLQADLSSLVDGELDEVAAASAMAKLESHPECRDFFENVRAQVRMHGELADSDKLVDQFARLVGAEPGHGFLAREAVHRLAAIFYQLGKAYALNAIDPDFRIRVFEKAAEIEPMRARGRGYVDGMSSRGASSGLDWSSKRHLLNGSLERIAKPLDKARKLLRECLLLEPDYEPALLWSAYIEMHDGRRVKAARMFEDVFRVGVDPASRGHAAVMLGKIHEEEQDYATALKWFRWVGISGLADDLPQFFFSRFNAGLCYSHLERPERALDSFRTLLDRHPDRITEIAGFFANSPGLRLCVESQPGFADALVERCPELFRAPSEAPDDHLR
ncbi:MAG: tetratricopeptide repeat protein [Planctomycetota bacterium]